MLLFGSNVLNYVVAAGACETRYAPSAKSLALPFFSALLFWGAGYLQCRYMLK